MRSTIRTARQRLNLTAWRTLQRVGEALGTRVPPPPPPPRRSGIDDLWDRARAESVDLITPHLASASTFSTSHGLRLWMGQHLLQVPSGLFLEFGYFTGGS